MIGHPGRRVCRVVDGQHHRVGDGLHERVETGGDDVGAFASGGRRGEGHLVGHEQDSSAGQAGDVLGDDVRGGGLDLVQRLQHRAQRGVGVLRVLRVGLVDAEQVVAVLDLVPVTLPVVDEPLLALLLDQFGGDDLPDDILVADPLVCGHGLAAEHVALATDEQVLPDQLHRGAAAAEATENGAQFVHLGAGLDDLQRPVRVVPGGRHDGPGQRVGEPLGGVAHLAEGVAVVPAPLLPLLRLAPRVGGVADDLRRRGDQ